MSKQINNGDIINVNGSTYAVLAELSEEKYHYYVLANINNQQAEVFARIDDKFVLVTEKEIQQIVLAQTREQILNSSLMFAKLAKKLNN